MRRCALTVFRDTERPTATLNYGTNLVGTTRRRSIRSREEPRKTGVGNQWDYLEANEAALNKGESGGDLVGMSKTLALKNQDRSVLIRPKVSFTNDALLLEIPNVPGFG